MHSKEKKEKFLKIIPLGGLEEVGRNMTIFEYNQDIIIVDMGLQFPEEDMLGIDYIIPNIAYLRGKEQNIRGVIITHAHYDHIGAIPHLIPKLGNPPIYTSKLTKGIILKRQEDFKGLPPLKIETINKDSRLKLGNIRLEFFHVNHNIPDGLGIVIKTPVGNVVHTGDFKFDKHPIADKPADIKRLRQIGKNGVLVLMSDSTNVEKAGHSISEQTIQNNLENIFKEAESRIIVATFASLISRIQEVINLAEKYHRKVAIDGYSMKMNVAIAKQLGYIKVKPQTLIKPKQVNDYPPEKIVILCTGAQGEGNAVLMRIVTKNHKYLHIQKGDAVVFSSSVVPGNEKTVQTLQDSLWRQGARVFHYQMMDIHASGHAYAEDLKEMIKIMKPKYLIPIHGFYYMHKLHSELAQEIGLKPKQTIVAENGKIILVNKNNIKMLKKKVPSNYVMVDGLGVGDVGQVVLRDRQMMSQDGIFVIIAIVDSKTGKVKGSPDIISRGFIYLRESKELLNEVRQRIKKIVAQTAGQQHPINYTYVKNNLRDKIGQFLYNKTQRRPMVLPVVIEV